MFTKGKIAGKYIPGICDRCGLRYPHSKLIKERDAFGTIGLLVCQSCYDGAHPQRPRRQPRTNDKQMVKDSRPDLATAESRSMWGFDPIGNDAVHMIGEVGYI